MSRADTFAYMQALETRAAWLEWAKRGPPSGSTWERDGYYAATMPAYIECLERGETFYMTPEFGRLVGHAIEGLPDNLAFELEWMIRPAGWLYLGQPHELPFPVGIPNEERKIHALLGAVGWRHIPRGTTVQRGRTGPTYTTEAPGTHFHCFVDYPRMTGHRTAGFGAWSFFLLMDGMTLGSRIRAFEHDTASDEPDGGGNYAGAAESRQHEIKWIYAAMHLMAQRLSVRVRHTTDRVTRRRAEKQGRTAPPFIEVVTLRRLEAARPKGDGAPRDWQWQWEVRGHWRNQWYAKEQVHKPKFIEAYTKGPTDRPFKEPGTKLFVARR